MKVAMGALAVLATVGGVLQIPFHVTDAVQRFLEPTFADSRYYHTLDPSNGFVVVGLVAGAATGLLGILIAYTVWVRRPGTSLALAERFAPVHALLVNRWYFDELLDVLFVRPAAWFGRFAQSTFERVFVNGTLVGGTSGVVRAGSAAVRAAQSGLVRSYAALLVLGLTAVSLYFLLQS
jgi:NADH-quinone oxidoreductase subunit L